LKKRVIELELEKISMKKLQMAIPFGREVRWRSVKYESCSKRGNKSSCQYPKGIGVNQNFKNPLFTTFFYFILKYYLGLFRYFKVLVLILSLVEKF